MESPREARRRRIVERGTDRLGFITGQVRSLSPSAPSKQEDRHHTVASVPEDDATRCDQIVSSTVESDAEKELFLKFKMSRELPKREKSNEIPKCETRTEFPEYERNNGIAIDGSAELLTTSAAHRSPDQVGDTAPSNAPQRSQRNFTPSQISRSITDSENIRLLCSVTIALLVVVLSYHGYLLAGKFVGSIINFRPLFLVLLTDATIVIGRLLLIQGRDHKDEEEPRRGGQEEHGWANDMGKALESAMVLQKALGAAFMDCSICAVIMISGLGNAVNLVYL